MAKNKEDTIFSLKDAAEYAGRTVKTIREWIEAGHLDVCEPPPPTGKRGRPCKYGVLKSSLDALQVAE